VTRALLLSLLLAGCSSAPEAPASRPPSDEAARRSYWRERVGGIFACRSWQDVQSFLDGLRVLPPHHPFHVLGGSYGLQGENYVFDDLYTLDESFNLYVVWNGRDPKSGVRSAEVVGFVDLRSKFRPEHFEGLQAVHRSASVGFRWAFDQVLLIRAVNAVRSLGPEAAPALRAYASIARSLPFQEARKYDLDVNRLFAVIQLLCSNPSPFGLGDGGVAYPGPSTWPLFPMTLEGGVPFIVVTGYLLEGVAEDPVRRLGAGFTLGTEPLAPTMNPVEAVEALTSSPRWDALMTARDPYHEAPTNRQAKELKMLVRRQALEALASVYRPPEDFVPKNCCEDPSEGAWREVVEQVRALQLRWDPERQDFVRSR
jgi:hypothetical protein